MTFAGGFRERDYLVAIVRKHKSCRNELNLCACAFNEDRAALYKGYSYEVITEIDLAHHLLV